MMMTTTTRRRSNTAPQALRLSDSHHLFTTHTSPMWRRIFSNLPKIIEAISELIDRIRMEPHDKERHENGIRDMSDRKKTERMAELLDRARDASSGKSSRSASSSSSGS